MFLSQLVRSHIHFILFLVGPLRPFTSRQVTYKIEIYLFIDCRCITFTLLLLFLFTDWLVGKAPIGFCRQTYLPQAGVT